MTNTVAARGSHDRHGYCAIATPSRTLFPKPSSWLLLTGSRAHGLEKGRDKHPDQSQKGAKQGFGCQAFHFFFFARDFRVLFLCQRSTTRISLLSDCDHPRDGKTGFRRKINILFSPGFLNSPLLLRCVPFNQPDLSFPPPPPRSLGTNQDQSKSLSCPFEARKCSRHNSRR